MQEAREAGADLIRLHTTFAIRQPARLHFGVTEGEGHTGQQSQRLLAVLVLGEDCVTSVELDEDLLVVRHRDVHPASGRVPVTKLQARGALSRDLDGG